MPAHRSRRDRPEKSSRMRLMTGFRPAASYSGVAILSFSDIAIEFGATTLLENVTLTVGSGERWGIVGRNGAGKTSLFRLITGALAPTRGTIARQPGLRVAMLDQDRDFGAATTVWEAAAGGYRDLLALEESLAPQGERLAALGDGATELDLERYGAAPERFAHGGGYQLHPRVDAVLEGLGVPAEASETPALTGPSA